MLSWKQLLWWYKIILIFCIFHTTEIFINAGIECFQTDTLTFSFVTEKMGWHSICESVSVRWKIAIISSQFVSVYVQSSRHTALPRCQDVRHHVYQQPNHLFGLQPCVKDPEKNILCGRSFFIQSLENVYQCEVHKVKMQKEDLHFLYEKLSSPVWDTDIEIMSHLWLASAVQRLKINPWQLSQVLQDLKFTSAKTSTGDLNTEMKKTTLLSASAQTEISFFFSVSKWCTPQQGKV